MEESERLRTVILSVRVLLIGTDLRIAPNQRQKRGGYGRSF